MDALCQISDRSNVLNYEKNYSWGLPFIGIQSHQVLEKTVLGNLLFTLMAL
jgi:hypothetical protein